MQLSFLSFCTVLQEQKQTESSLVDIVQGKEDKGMFIHK